MSAAGARRLQPRRRLTSRPQDSAARPDSCGVSFSCCLTRWEATMNELGTPCGPHMRMRHFAFLFCLLTLVSVATAASAKQPWLTLPPTPSLPKAEQSGYAPVNGIKIWYAEFGKGEPVILLHGGLANSNYWGLQVPALDKCYRVIV